PSRAMPTGGTIRPMLISKVLFKDDLAMVLSPNLSPAVNSIKSLGACAGRGCQSCGHMTGSAQDVASDRKERASDAASLIGRMDEERKNRSVARVGGREALNRAVFVPDPEGRMLDDPAGSRANLSDRHWVQQSVLAHGVPNLENARKIRARRFAYHGAVHSVKWRAPNEITRRRNPTFSPARR